MARRRRKRKPQRSEAPDQHEATTSEDAGDDASSSLDDLCLIHPTRAIEAHCDICEAPLCLMCAFEGNNQTLCNHCFEDQIAEGAFESGAWQGWAALVLGLIGIAAVLGAFSFADDRAILEALPTGRHFFQYASTAAGAAGIVLGFAAQDIDGMSKRAGMVGALFSLVVLVAVVTLNLIGVISRAG